jgi:predicted alpha/beta-hydrolase family hydrolase
MPKRKRTRRETATTHDTQNDSAVHKECTPKRKRSKLESVDLEDTKNAERIDVPGITPFDIPYNGKPISCERHGLQDGQPSLIFTHGAGGGISAAAVQEFATGFAATAPVVCFEGNMNLKSRVKMFHAAIENQACDAALGGRSMGARAAVMAALETEKTPAALVLASYPLTAGGQENKRQPETREQILIDLPEEMAVLFLSGSQDSQCDLEILAEVREKMKAKTWLVEVDGADHGMSVKPKEAVQPVRVKTGAIAAEWLSSRDELKQHCRLAWNQDESVVLCHGWEEQQVTEKQPQRKKRKTES